MPAHARARAAAGGGDRLARQRWCRAGAGPGLGLGSGSGSGSLPGLVLFESGAPRQLRLLGCQQTRLLGRKGATFHWVRTR